MVAATIADTTEEAVKEEDGQLRDRWRRCWPEMTPVNSGGDLGVREDQQR
jgi:hypothetical protein